MGSPNILSLRMRLGGMLGLLFIIGGLVLYIAALAYGRTAADASYDRLLSGSAMSIAETLSVRHRDVEVDIPYSALDMLSAAPEDRVFYRVFIVNGPTVTGYGDLPPLPSAVQRSRAPDPDGVRLFDARYSGELIRFAILTRSINEPGLRGTIGVQVGHSRLARTELAEQLALRAIIPIVLTTIMAVAIVWFGIKIALQPLQRIGDDLAIRRPDDLHVIDEAIPIEVAPLVEAINGFMRRLRTNIDALRAFVGDAAHQMRTPLAALQAQAQVADGDDPTELRRSLAAVERNAAKLSRLLNQLLSDATVIHRSDVQNFETFDLVSMVRQAIRDAVPMSGTVTARFQSDLTAAPFNGDRLMLSEALKNLLDNAIRHGGGSEISVELGEEAGNYALSVCDRGPGIPSARREEVWERFASGSRAAGGVGLGMAIAKRAVEGQGGRIELHDRKGGGFCVKILLQRSAQ